MVIISTNIFLICQKLPFFRKIEKSRLQLNLARALILIVLSALGIVSEKKWLDELKIRSIEAI